MSFFCYDNFKCTQCNEIDIPAAKKEEMKITSLLHLIRNVQVKTLEKGEVLLPQGSTSQHLFLVRKGLIRSFRAPNKAEQEETTFQLFSEHQLAGNVHAILLNEPSVLTYEAIEKTKVYIIDYGVFNQAVVKKPELGEFSRKFLGKRMVKQAFQRIESFVFLTPEKRYLKYIDDFPNIINRAPDKYIANILGITPTSLSRIRKRISTKG